MAAFWPLIPATLFVSCSPLPDEQNNTEVPECHYTGGGYAEKNPLMYEQSVEQK